MAHEAEIIDQMYHLARLALSGRRQDILMQIRRMSRRLKNSYPEIATRFEALLTDQPTRQSPIRSETIEAVPVDSDSRLQLARVEHTVELDIEPIWDESVLRSLKQVILERSRQSELHEAGLLPTKSALFTGLPGVGKTLAARWLARELRRPLLTLNLAAVMSSLLGRTGSNMRQVLDYAKGTECILLLDELDAVAKRRDDATDIGELKRLVTVLLQEIDDWPASGLLLAATNHPDLLDPAVWRRFDLVVQFPIPGEELVRQFVTVLLKPYGISDKVIEAAVAVFRGRSFSDIERDLLRARRDAVVHGLPVAECVLQALVIHVHTLPHAEQVRLATMLVEAGWSQRKASELTGIHRNTIKKATRAE